MTERTKFYQRPILLVASLIGFVGIGLALLAFFGQEDSTTAVHFGTSFLAGMCITMAVADNIWAKRTETAHLQVLGLGVATLMIEILLIISVGILVIAILLTVVQEVFDFL